MYPPEVVHALREALRHCFWYKNDLRLFLESLDLPRGLVARQAWHDPQEYKVKIVGAILADLAARSDDGLGPMRRLIKAVLDIATFDHLRRLDDGPAKVQAARRHVEALRALVERHDATIDRPPARRPIARQPGVDPVRRRNDEIERLRDRFNDLVTVPDPQARGVAFERFLADLFAAYDLDPRGSFRVTGEQIDGAFELDGTQFILEAKWEQDRQGAAPLDSFARKVERRLDNTLGAFIALNGFTDDGLAAIRRSRPSVILVDGEDLALVLQGLVDLRDLLKRKLRHAAQTGDPYLHARDIWTGS
jgi:hypothetical protein